MADYDALAANGNKRVSSAQVDSEVSPVLTKEHIHERKQVDSYDNRREDEAYS